MTKKELKIKNENLFLRNTMLLHLNQKLRDKITILLSSRGCETCTKFNEVKLTKAKELLELFVQWNYGCCKIPDLKDIVKQAEQFIKEIEK